LARFDEEEVRHRGFREEMDPRITRIFTNAERSFVKIRVIRGSNPAFLCVLCVLCGSLAFSFRIADLKGPDDVESENAARSDYP
jgi:hypothetical protein